MSGMDVRGSGSPQPGASLPDDRKSTGKMADSEGKKDHKITLIKDKLTEAKSSIKNTFGSLRERIGTLFHRSTFKSDLPASPEASTPNMKFLDSKEPLDTPDKIVKELKLLGHGKDFLNSSLADPKINSPGNKAEKKRLQESLQVVESKIQELTNLFRDMTNTATPTRSKPPNRKPPAPPTGASRQENQGISREGKRPMPPPPRPSRKDFPLPDGSKARDK